MSDSPADVVGAALAVAGLGFWSPEATTVAALRGRTSPAPADGLPAAGLLGARARGRASLLTLMFAEVAQQAANAAGMPVDSFATIFASAYGEMERLIQLLEAMQSPNAEVSPLRFQTSVHNASAGQISIVAKNQRFSTSLAAGVATVAMAFVEAAAWMQWHRAPLLLVLGDEAPPPRISLGPSYPPLAAAFALLPDDTAPASLPRLWLRQNGAAAPRPAPSAIDAGGNPCAVLAPLVTWLEQGTPRSIFPLSNLANAGYGIERT